MEASPDIVAAIIAAYPARAADAARSCVAVGGPIQGQHQKYRLSDGTVVCMPWVAPAPTAPVPTTSDAPAAAVLADALEAHVSRGKKRVE